MHRHLISVTLLLLAHPAMAQSARSRSDVAAMRELRTSSDTAALKKILYDTRFITDSGIYVTAAEIAADPGASPEARVTSLGVLHAYDREGNFVLYEDLASGACTHLGLMNYRRPRTVSPLPPDYQERTHQIASTLSGGQTTPTIVRSATKCLMLSARMREDDRPVDPSLIELVYLCNNRFAIRNGNRRVVMVDVRMAGTSEQWYDQPVMARPEGQPYGETTFFTKATGTVELPYHGQVILSAANGGTTCTS